VQNKLLSKKQQSIKPQYVHRKYILILKILLAIYF